MQGFFAPEADAHCKQGCLRSSRNAPVRWRNIGCLNLLKDLEGEIEMKKITFLLTMIVLSFVSVFGQNAAGNSSPCTNQTVEKISSRGISLGMSRDETLNLFLENGRLGTVVYAYLQDEGQTKFLIEEVEYKPALSNLQSRANRNFGYSIISLVAKDTRRFDGIWSYDLGFLDDRLAFFKVHYLKPDWESLEQFTNYLSETLNLPKQPHQDTNPRIVKCGDYTIEFGEYIRDESRYAMSVSADVEETLRQRGKNAADEQRKKDIKVFKP